MLGYLVHRILIMIPTLIAISIVIFIIIHLPPGDYFSTYIAELQSQGEKANLAKIAFLKAQYGFDKPLWEQYLYWAVGLLHGDMGYSFLYDLPVNKVVGDRLLLTFIVSFTTIIFTYVVAFPIGVYSATHQYSSADYVLTFLGFLGLATPSFLLALVLVYLAHVYFGISVGGLMDPIYVDKPWSWGKALSVLAHIWIPVIVIGTAGTASMIRRLRANLLDELQKQYVVTARAKGLHPLQGAVQIPAAHGAQPVHLGYRLAVAACHFGRGDGLGGDVAADHRADAARGAAQPGHVSRRLVPDVHGVPDGDRRVPVGSGAGGARSAHPPAGRAPAMSEIGLTAGRAAPEKARGARRCRRADAALRLAGAVRSLCRSR